MHKQHWVNKNYYSCYFITMQTYFSQAQLSYTKLQRLQLRQRIQSYQRLKFAVSSENPLIFSQRILWESNRIFANLLTRIYWAWILRFFSIIYLWLHCISFKPSKVKKQHLGMNAVSSCMSEKNEYRNWIPAPV